MGSIAAKVVRAIRYTLGVDEGGGDARPVVPPPRAAGDISLSGPQMASLRTTRDELAATLACLRQMTEPPIARPREPIGDQADPYPVICADLRAALAHLRRAEQAGRFRG
jgi:hypothetical protein